MAVTLVAPDDMFKFSKIERLIDRELDKEQPPVELGAGPEWRAPQGKGKGRKPAPSKANSDRSKSRGERKNSDRKPRVQSDNNSAGSDVKNRAESSKKPTKKRSPSKYQLLFDALPNPKAGLNESNSTSIKS